jgi:voltage-gated potassium channel Kch
LRSEGLNTAGYLSILLFLFCVVPVGVLVARRFHLSKRFRLDWLVKRVAALDTFKGLMLSNRELSRRPLNMQLEAYLYSLTNWGLVLDLVQSALSLVSCGLVLYSSTFPFTVPDPPWAVALEAALTLYFLLDYSLRFFLAQDRLAFYFSPLSLLDYITIVPGLLALLLISARSFDPGAFIVSQTLRVFRIFRVVRLLRILSLSSYSSLTRQFIVLAVTVFAMVFAAAAVFQILDSTPDHFVPFLHAVLAMTITIIGRPPVVTHTDAAKIMEIIAIVVGSFLLPAFVAELARLYFEQQGRDTYASDPRVPHVILCGAINTSRLRAFLAQFFHKSRDPDLLSPMVVLADHPFQGALKALIDQSSYGGSIKYIRGSARRPGDLSRAGVKDASSVIVLCHCTNDVDPATADAEVVAAALAVKSKNNCVKVLAQLRRPRARDHLQCVPGWRIADRAVAVPSLSMTLLGVGCLVPGLPTLLTNLVHQGNKSNARSSNPRRRTLVSSQRRRLGLDLGAQTAGLIVANTTPWWAMPVAACLEALEEVGTAVLGGAAAAPRVDWGADGDDAVEQLLRPMSVTEEYTSGFAQDMFAFAVTPGLARRTFAAAARIAYLRYGVLLIGARVPADAAAEGLPPEADAGEDNYKVLLFPADVVLTSAMYLHGIAFDALDLAALLAGTGGDAAVSAMQARLGAAGGPPSPMLGRKPSSDRLSAEGGGSGHGGGARGGGAHARHNAEAERDISEVWCFTEQQEDAFENVRHALRAVGEERKAERLAVSGRMAMFKCTCAGAPHGRGRGGGGGGGGSSSSAGAWGLGAYAPRAATPAAAAAAAVAVAAPAAPAPAAAPTPRRRPRLQSEFEGGDDGFGSILRDAAAPPPARSGGGSRGGGRAAGSKGGGRGASAAGDEDEEEDELDELDDEDEEDEDEEEEEDDQVSGADEDGFSVSLHSKGGKGRRGGGGGGGGNGGGGGGGGGGGPRRAAGLWPPPHLAAFGGMQRGMVRPPSLPAPRSRIPSAGAGEEAPTAAAAAVPPPAAAAISSALVAAAASPPSAGAPPSQTEVAARHLQKLFPFLFPAAGARAGGGRGGGGAAAAAAAAPPPPPLHSYFYSRVPLAPPPAPSQLSKHANHVLICGMTDSLGLLLRALMNPPPLPPLCAGGGPIVAALSASVAALSKRQGGFFGGAGLPAAATEAALASAVKAGHVPIVVLCPLSERSGEAGERLNRAMNSMHAGSARLLARVTYIPGSPSDMEDLLKAGVENARAVIVLSTKRVAASDGNDNLADDTDAVVAASAVYKARF